MITMRTLAPRLFALAAVGLISLSPMSNARANGSWQVAYVPAVGSNITSKGLLVDWQSPTRARVVADVAARSGSVSRQGFQFVITLDSPISRVDFSGEPDSRGEFADRRRDTAQFVFRDLPGDGRRDVSQVVEIGELITLTGCDAGLAVPFGTLTDSGVPLNRVPMITRPSMHDLVPGTQIAGFSEQEWPLWDTVIAQDVATLYAGGQALFANTGRVVPVANSNDKWLVFDFGTFQRAYTRLSVDDETGAETWLRAEWSDGMPQRVTADLVTKVSARSGFGNERQASRAWESGLFFKSPSPFFINLYLGGTGERINVVAPGVESRRSITWAFSGRNIVQTYVLEGSPRFRRDRTWVPLRNHGDKIRFVLESETMTNEDEGFTFTFLPARVNFYIDRGRAVPPPTN